jgi:hypothetical protein
MNVLEHTCTYLVGPFLGSLFMVGDYYNILFNASVR